MKGLDLSSRMPSEMQEYIENYGFHFSKKAFDYASEGMPIVSKEKVETMQQQYGVNIENDVLYDKAWVATMAKNDFSRSIDTEPRLVNFVKEYLDDEDGSGEEPFRRWISDRIGRGKPIDWYSLL